MHTTDNKFERSDIWREGKWLDLWSIVHVISGVSLGFGAYFLHFGAAASTALVFVLLVAYEMWEAMVKILEAPTNRFADVVVGMAGFLPAFFIVAPRLSGRLFVEVFILVVTANVAMSVLGWRASQKAAALERRMRERYAVERARLMERRAHMGKKLRH